MRQTRFITDTWGGGEYLASLVIWVGPVGDAVSWEDTPPAVPRAKTTNVFKHRLEEEKKAPLRSTKIPFSPEGKHQTHTLHTCWHRPAFSTQWFFARTHTHTHTHNYNGNISNFPNKIFHYYLTFTRAVAVLAFCCSVKAFPFHPKTRKTTYDFQKALHSPGSPSPPPGWSPLGTASWGRCDLPEGTRRAPAEHGHRTPNQWRSLMASSKPPWQHYTWVSAKCRVQRWL